MTTPRPALIAAAVLLVAGALPRTAAAQPRVVQLRKNVMLVSALGGKCLDVEGGGAANGTRVIGYPCSGTNFNQQWFFNANGTVTHAGKCLDERGGMGRDGDDVVLWDCNGGRGQQWQLSNGRLLGLNGKCLDLKGGAWGNLPFVNQPTILFTCNNQDNQRWSWAFLVSQSKVSGVTVIPAGAAGRINPLSPAAVAMLIGQDGGGLVASGGGNLVASGGGNLVASGGGNLVAAGGGNLVAAGGGN